MKLKKIKYIKMTTLSYIVKHAKLQQHLFESIRWTTFNKCQDLFFQFKSIVIEYIDRYKTDEAIYKHLRKYFKTAIVNDPRFKDCQFKTKPQTQSATIMRLIQVKSALLPPDHKKIKYLDIGSGDCSITVATADLLHLSYKNVYATDILYANNKECKKINFIKVDNDHIKLPKEFKSQFNLVTCFMSLHHIKKEIIGEIYRVLAPNGILVIREHDAGTDDMKTYLDALHIFYMYVFGDELKKSTDYWAKYYSQNDLQNKLEETGLKKFAHLQRSNNIGKKYHAAYIKEAAAAPTTGGDDVNLLPNVITECAITENGRPVCVSDELATAIAGVIGADRTDDIKEIMNQAKDRTKCETERCVLNTELISSKLDKKLISRDLAQNFKIRGPTDTTLLSNLELDAILRQWSMKFTDFYANDFNMADYDKYGGTLSTLDMCEDIYELGFRTFGCIVNTDVHSGVGIHWMALFADMRGPKWTVEFFNSSGNPPAEPWRNWMKRAAISLKKCDNTRDIDEIEMSNGQQNQKSKTECGMYSLYYIWMRLNGTPPEFFKTHKIPDVWMFEMRQHIFDGPFEDEPFDYEKFSKYADVRWEK